MKKEPQFWVAEQNHSIIGAVVAWQENNQTHWGRFVVRKSYRGLHIGTKLASISFADIFVQQIECVHIDAREVTARILCKMGGRVTGKATPFYKGTVTPIVIDKHGFEKWKLSNNL